MPRPVKFRKQYEPIGFGDPLKPRSVEGHQVELENRRKARREEREVEELAAMQQAAKPLRIKFLDRFRSWIGR